MLGKIIEAHEEYVKVKLELELTEIGNLLNYYVVFMERENYKLIGEIIDINQDLAAIKLVGEMKNNNFFVGIAKRPSFNTSCRFVNEQELRIILGETNLVGKKTLNLGKIPLYNNFPLNVELNSFFSNHFAVFGNTGSGKSYAIARILQNVYFNNNGSQPQTNIFLFDAYGEYHGSFQELNHRTPGLAFKAYTTNLYFPDSEVLKIPVWLLGIDDIALLLDANNHIQLPIIEKALRLVSVFAREETEVITVKNDIIARAVLEILYSGNQPSQIRDQVIAVLSTFKTNDLNLDSKVVQPGYVRTLRQCLIIDKDGKLSEMQLVTEFISSFIQEGVELELPDGSFPYTLNDLKEAFDFALISEGILKSDKVYDYANILKVRLNSLINSSAQHYFKYDKFITKYDYIMELLTMPDGRKAQIVNFNINYIDDRLAKVITKIYSKLLYDYVASLEKRASFPIHIILEEAHRYVQNDNDIFLLGYNIFDRITKEGRKYGIILGLISQRPSELSETALSQCSNFLSFRMIHPRDSDFIHNMVPAITKEIVEKLKNLQPGTCVAFGGAFKLPFVVHFDLPDPAPISSNADIARLWYQQDVEEL